MAPQVTVLVLHSLRGIYYGYMAAAGLDIICVRSLIYILPMHIDLRCLGVSGVAGVVQQLPRHLNPYLQPSSTPLLLNQGIGS